MKEVVGSSGLSTDCLAMQALTGQETLPKLSYHRHY